MEQRRTSRLFRQLACFLLSVLSGISLGTVLGFIIGAVYVEVANVSSFEGGAGFTVMYITMYVIPLVVIANISLHLIMSADGWPKRLLALDAVAIVVVPLLIWFLME